MTNQLLLDEMFSSAIAQQLRALGHDVVAVLEDPSLVGAADAVVLARATNDNRAVVTRNIKDFVALDNQLRGEARLHAGIVLVTSKSFPEDRNAIGALVRALHALLQSESLPTAQIYFLQS